MSTLPPIVPSEPIQPCAPDKHEWANEATSNGFMQARCIVCLRWVSEVIDGFPKATGERA